MRKMISGNEMFILPQDIDVARYVDTGEILPCPFCGSKAMSYGEKNPVSLNIVYHVKCNDTFGCGASVFSCIGKEDRANECRDVTIKKWNTRKN